MNVSFYSPNPRDQARHHLDRILSAGADQVAIAVAFCTKAGVAMLKTHAARLRLPDSFVVVSASEPTNFEALEELYRLIPGHLYVHFGNVTPHEILVGRSLMHSKVYYSREGQNCFLWTGSNNLTASAMLGANCEAAVLLEGQQNEAPFHDALAHLIACRDEAQLFYPGMRSPGDIDLPIEETLIIHAEGTAAPPSWHCHLRIPSPDYDEILGPPENVRLFLYVPGTLGDGWQHARPHTALSGTLTALNLTAAHPQYSGIEASWTQAEYVIDATAHGGAPVLGNPSPDPPGTTTQAMLSIDHSAETDEVWVSKKLRKKDMPRSRMKEPTEIDSDMKKFFSSKSLREGRLIHQVIEGYDQIIEIPAEDLRESDVLRIEEKFQGRVVRKEGKTVLRQGFAQRHPFIYRAKFRL